MYSSKNVLGVYFVKYFYLKNGLFSTFKSISAGNRLFWRRLCTLRAAKGDFFTPLTPTTTTPCPGTRPTNNRCIKQFLSHPHSL
jgi:hypothetical protein